ncbi:hypothetical protein [Roseimaritima sediminicola]|uniref:hypothetical protein n=1 Tax=Roseimaritima sediminicola TaxID=2662066 RepID=UPI0012982D1D|nr:hypothetical protein [Roseimaritima sediminicola]
MRVLLCVTVVVGAVSLGTPPAALGQSPAAASKAWEPLSRVGRTLGIGWGDGYHACDRDCRLPTADLPPRSYAAQHAGHGPSGRQHWYDATARQRARYWAAHQLYPAVDPYRPARDHDALDQGPRFNVPRSVFEELEAIEDDASGDDEEAGGDEPQDWEQLPGPPPTESRDAATSSAQALPQLTGEAASDVLPENDRLIGDVPLEDDSLLEGDSLLEDDSLLEGDSLLEDDSLLEGDSLLEDDSLLLQQTRRDRFVREPIATRPESAEKR